MKNKEEYFVINRNLPGYNPLHFGQEQCAPLHFYGPGYRPYLLIHYIVSGKGVFCVHDKTYRLGASQCFVVHPGDKVFYQADEFEPWHYIWICFQTDRELPEVLCGDVLNVPGLGEIFAAIIDAKRKNEGRAAYLSAKIWELLSLAEESEQPRRPRNNQFAARVRSCIETNYMTGLTVTSIARTLNLERSYFSTLFRSTFGCSPQEYLSRYRLETAAKMLTETDRSITDIAYSTGYTSVVNFSRMFKRRFNLAPSDFRSLHRDV